MAIKVWEPRYRDMKVLVARFKLPPAQDITIEIQKGSRKGLYLATSEVICNSDVEYINAKNGRRIGMRAIPFDKLERIDNASI